VALTAGLHQMIKPPPRIKKANRLTLNAVMGCVSIFCLYIAGGFAYWPTVEASIRSTIPGQTPSPMVKDSGSVTPEPNTLDGVRISGSWQFGDGRTAYLFARGVQPTDSAEVRRWVVTGYSPCAAHISLGRFAKEVYCEFSDNQPEAKASGVVGAAIPTDDSASGSIKSCYLSLKTRSA